MGKVGDIELRHKNSGKSVWVQINFYTKSKMFKVVDMPEEVKDWYGSKRTREEKYGRALYSGEVQAKSYDELEKLAKDLYDEYYDLEINETKIIAYKLKCNLPKQEGELSARTEFFHGLRHTLGIEYYVIYRFKIGDETFLSTGTYEQSKMPKTGHRAGGHKMKREDSHNDFYDFIKIDYTEEMHTFFKNVESGLDGMIKNVVGFFGEDEQTLLENIKIKGVNLLN